MTIAELAQFFGVSKREMYNALRREADSGFPAFRVGRKWQVNLDELREWMCRREEDRQAEASKKANGQ